MAKAEGSVDMCGICGVFGRRDEEVVAAMTASLAHRGPDSVSCISVGNHVLGGTRLHITGEADAPFPFSSPQGGHVVLLNGEIYNFRSWQQKLSSEGYQFRTGTDTEVVWFLYEKFGENFVRHLKGMFAVAVLDGDKLILARDRMGVKPLYYVRTGKELAFGSEIKALLRYLATTPELNIGAYQEILTFGYINNENDTLFQRIFQVPPSGILIFDGNELKTDKYYLLRKSFSLPASGHEFRKQRMVLHKLLPSVMETILGHDSQEKGIFLSGGVDSTMMAVLAKEAGWNTQTFNLIDSEDSPDLPWSRRVAGVLGCKHHEFKVNLEEYLEEMPRFVYHYENIVAAGIFDPQGGMAFHLLCKKASQFVKVILTGEGADELFGGYYWTHTHPLGFSDRLYDRLIAATKYRSNPGLIEAVQEIFPIPEDETVYRLHVFDLLLRGGLANYHLCSVDRSCGAFGFEARPFYLFDDIVEFATSLPVELKVPSSHVTKLLLKEVASECFAQYGLGDVVNRQKFGMPAALHHINSQCNQYVADCISDACLERHPYRQFLTSKIDMLFFDLFYYIFFYCGGHLQDGFKVKDALKGGIFENMYDN
ncbi:MAG: asparagine synthase (glutamine-hydrolyzing) [Smithella sp.]